MTVHHGNTPAAWAGVAVVLLGFVIGGLGLVLDSMPIFWIGVVIAPLGGLVGLVLSRMGLGVAPIHDR